MTKEEMKALSRQFLKAFEVSDFDAMRQIFSDDFVSYQVGAPGPLSREELIEHIAEFNTAFSDQQYTIADQIVEGDRVVTRCTWRGIHTGAFLNVPATGKEITITGINIDRIEDDKIVERWLNHDVLALLQQIGLVPLPQEN